VLTVARGPATPAATRSAATWNEQLLNLAAALAAGRVYDRDLDVLAPGLAGVVDAYNARKQH